MANILDMLVGFAAQVSDLPDVSDPLSEITQIISREPHTPRTRVLTGILRGLAIDKGEFSESDIYALDREALALVVLLTQDLLNGRYGKQELLQ